MVLQVPRNSRKQHYGWETQRNIYKKKNWTPVGQVGLRNNLILGTENQVRSSWFIVIQKCSIYVNWTWKPWTLHSDSRQFHNVNCKCLFTRGRTNHRNNDFCLQVSAVATLWLNFNRKKIESICKIYTKLLILTLKIESQQHKLKKKPHAKKEWIRIHKSWLEKLRKCTRGVNEVAIGFFHSTILQPLLLHILMVINKDEAMHRALLRITMKRTRCFMVSRTWNNWSDNRLECLTQPQKNR